MALSSEEARVLACLIEKQVTVPDTYPLTLNALRLACNQTSSRHPVVTYDDRTVEQALLSLKSMGLVRFVHPAQGGRTTRYRHIADERWRLSPGDLGVLSVLVLRGPQTAGEIRARAERHLEGSDQSVDEILDSLVARSPEPFALRLDRRPGEREPRFAHLLCGDAESTLPEPPGRYTSEPSAPVAPPAEPGEIEALRAVVAELRGRLDRLESLLGVDAESD